MLVTSPANGIHQNHPSSKRKIRILPSSRPGQRRAPRKWAKSATLPSPGTGRRRPKRDARKASRPLASTRKRARICRVAPLSADARVDPVRVEAHLLHRRRLQQRHALMAQRVIEQDLVELGPRHLEGPGRPRLALAEVERVLEPCFLIVKERPVLGDEPRAGESGRARPGARTVAHWPEASDSPDVEAREQLSRSTTATERPPRASSVATVAPPGPPPITSTSSRAAGESRRRHASSHASASGKTRARASCE